jgi:uncharacterized coiled-coil DUF342 family protein
LLKAKEKQYIASDKAEVLRKKADSINDQISALENKASNFEIEADVLYDQLDDMRNTSFEGLQQQ